MRNGLLLFFAVSLSLNAFCADFFWIGGTGNWSDANHWSATTGGTIPVGSTPTAADNVIFDGGSGFTASTDLVTMDGPVTVVNFNFNAAPAFTLAGVLVSIEIRGNLAANGSTIINFAGAINMFSTSAGSTLTSNGQAWTNNFVFTGSAAANGVSLTDAFNTTGSISITQGLFNTSSNNIECSTFASTNVGARTITLNNSAITLSGTTWSVAPGTGPNPLVWSATGSNILLNNIGSISFTGGALTYADLNSKASVLSIAGANTFANVTLDTSSILNLENNLTHTFLSLIAFGTCADPFDLRATILGNPAASISITGSANWNSQSLIINKVNAVAPTNYNVALSTITSSTGWTPSAAKFYWIGNSGDWNSFAHWSLNSGGLAAGCIPSALDSVFFDVNSFTLTNQVVLVDDDAFFKSMHWTGITGNQSLSLDSNMMSYGDVRLHPNMTLKRNIQFSGVQFNKPAALFPNAATIDCSFLIKMSASGEILTLNNDLIMSDTSSIIFFNGGFNTQNNKVVTGTLKTINNTGPTDLRSFTMGSSSVHIKQIFDSSNDVDFTLNAGTSNLYVGDTVIYLPDTLSLKNGLLTSNSVFYNVTLNFQPLTGIDQTVSGNNTFNKFKILPGSNVAFGNGSTQVVNDSLVIKGTCADSIYIYSDGAGQFSITKATSTNVIAQCIDMQDCNVSTAQTYFFSTNSGNNTNWTLSTNKPVTAAFSSSTPDCRGDTTTFINTSSSPFGSISYEWNYNDGVYLADSSALIEATKTTVVTFPQPVGIHDTVVSQLTNWTEITDAMALFTPIPGAATNLSGNESMSFNFNMDYDFNLINSTGSNAYLVDMNSSVLTAKYKYRPRIFVYKNGAYLPGAVSQQTAFTQFVQNEGTLSAGTTLLGSDNVNVNITSANILPTDVLTIYVGLDVVFDTIIGAGATSMPRWKSTNSTGGSDVQINTQLNINSISFTAVPTTIHYYDTLQHLFPSQGNYNVVLIATNGSNQCTDTITHVVGIFEPTPFISTSQLDTTICLGDQVTFEASSSTPGSTFEFFINGVSQNTPSVTDTLLVTSSLNHLDTISVMVYASGCPAANEPNYVFVVNPLPTFTWTSSDADTSVCLQQTISFDANGVAGTSFQHLINNSSVTAFTAAGTYSTSALVDNDTVNMIAKSNFGCRDTAEMIFNVNPLPATSLSHSSPDLVICSGESVTYTASGASTYEFFVNGVSQGLPSATNTWTTSSITNGQTVSVIGYSALGCQFSAPQTFTYIVNNLPAIALSSSDADNTICSGTSVTFTASGGSLYEFFVDGVSQGALSATPAFTSSTFANGNSINVTGSFSGCAFTTPAIVLTVNTSPTTNLTSDDPDNSICSGTSVLFTATGATSYQYFVNGVSQGAPSAIDTFLISTLTNNQTISVIGISNTCPVTDQLTFTVLNNPSVSLFSNDADNTICSGAAITFTGANAASYQLLVNGVPQGAAQASPVFTNPTLIAGNNTIQVIGTAANTCTGNSNIINTLVNPIPAITVLSSDSDNTICSGESVTFTASGGSMYQFFLDGTAQGSLSPTNTFTTTGLSNGQVLQVTGSALGCVSNSSTITTTVNSVPSVTLTGTDIDNAFCFGSSITYNAAGASTYQFTLDGVSQGPFSAISAIDASTFGVGTHILSVQGLLGSCVATASKNITIYAIPNASLSSSDADNVICSGQTVTYSASGAANYQFFVNALSQGPSTPISILSTSSLVNGDVISVISTSSQGCVDNDVLASITVNPTPVVLLTSSDLDQQICINDNVIFTASGAASYEFFINGTSQGSPSASTTFATTSIATGDDVMVIGSTLGCSDPSAQMNFIVFGPPIVSLVNNEDNQICTGQNTNLTASGAANFQFLINGSPFGPFSPVANFTSTLNNGDVVTVVGESNGCTTNSLDTYTFTVLNYPTLTSTSSDADNVICLSDLVTFNASGAPEFRFELNGNTVQTGVTSSFSLSSLLNGDVVTITGLNGDCPSTPDTYTFIVNSMVLDLLVSPSSMICAGENASFTASGADQYQFFVNGVSQGPLSSTPTFNSTTLTNFDEITFTGYSTTTTCTQPFSDYIIMNVIDQPVVSTMSGPDFCEGDSVILNSNSSYGNQWFMNGMPIAGATDTSYVAYASGSYSLETTLGGNGNIWSFGYNAQGTFGDGTNINNPDPTVAVTTQTFDEISSGADFILGVTTSGSVYAWGENSSGQLGNGTYTSGTLPAVVPTLAGVKTVATSESSSMAVTNTGTVYVWGNNSVGQLATGNTSVINFPFLNGNLTNVDSIAGGKNHFVVLKNDGTVWTVGNNSYGQLGQGNLTPSMLPVQVSALSNVVSVGAGEYHSFAIDNNGDLYVWGNNGSGQLGLDDLNNRLTPSLSPLKNIINAQGGAVHSLFISSEEKVFSTGGNQFGQLGSGDYVDRMTPFEVNISGGAMISAGQYTSLVRRQDNSVFGFGNNLEEQLSSPSGTSVNIPEHITDLNGVTFIEAGKTASHVIFGDDQVCSSAAVVLNMLAVPAVTITEAGGVLTTITGVAYQWYFNGSLITGANSQSITATSNGNYSVEVTFANGCTGISAEYPFGVTELTEKEMFVNVYPNPSNGIFNVQLSASTELSFQVRDVAGRLVMDQLNPQNGFIQIDMRSYSEGMYMIEVLQNGNIIDRKQIIKNDM